MNSIAKSPTTKASEGNITSSTHSALQSVDFPPSNPSTEQIKQHIADLSQKYGLEYDQLVLVIGCESQFNLSSYGDGGLAFGIAQFHKTTFDEWCAGDYHNTYDQLDCMAKMFNIGQAGQWSCFKKLYIQAAYYKEGSNKVILAASKN